MDRIYSSVSRRFLRLISGLLFGFLALSAQAVTLEWDRNPETNVTGYRVYVGRQSRVYDSVLDVANQTMATIAARAGTSFYAVTAYNADGLESDFSDEVSYAPPWTNSPPQAMPDNYATTKNIPRVVSPPAGVLVNDVDVDPHPLTAVLVTLPANGTVVLAANGSFVYTPVLDFVGQDWFGYSVSDGLLTSAVAVVTITVTEAPSSGSQGCTNCFTALDALLAVRSVEMQALIAARTSVPTNMTCPKLGVFIFGAVSRAARALNDVELNAVLASTAECLTWNLSNELAEKVTSTSGLLPSRWTATASNQALAASHLLAGLSSSSNSLRQARLLANAAAILQRLDKSIAAGDLAPASLRSLVATC